MTEKREKKGHTTVTRYTLRLSEAGKGKLKLSFEDLSVISFDGKDANSPEAQKTLGPLRALAAAMPSFVITKEGDLSEVEGLEECAEKALDLLRETKGAGMDQKVMKSVESTMRSPLMIEQMKAKVADYWNIWVGTWVELELKPGEEEKTTIQVPVFGDLLEAPVEYKNHGAAEGSPGAIRLTCTMLLHGEKAEAAMQKMLQTLAKQTGSAGKEAPEIPEDAYKGFRRETVAEVVTDPMTLRPVRASYVMNMSMPEKDGKLRSQRESAEYSFEWRPADRK